MRHYRRLVLPADIAHLITVSSPAVAPDGRRVAFVVIRVDADANTYRSQVWLAEVDASVPPTPFSSGEHGDAAPAWSPDGRRLAFTSHRADGGDDAATLHVAPVGTGGEVVTVARSPEAITDVGWSPDGRHLAYVTRVRAQRYADDDPRRQPPRRITHLYSRLDGTGFTVDRPRHPFVVAADGSAPARDLAPGDHELVDPRWSPDSTEVVVAGATHGTWDLDLAVDLFAIDVASGDRRRLTGTDGDYGHPSVSPDGTRIACIGTDDHETSPRNLHVGVLPRTCGSPTWVSDALDRTFAPFPGVQAPQWLDGDTLVASVEDRGNTHLYAIAADGATPPRPLWAEEGCITGFDVAAGVIAIAVSAPTRPGELVVLVDGQVRPLTDLSAGFAATAQLRPYQPMLVPSTDGTVELDAWVLLPPDHDPDRSYPALVNVHGGPFTQYANRFFDEVQIQARAGYIVVWSNPRGGSGREEAFGRAINGPALGGSGWGGVDYDDVMAVVDFALAAHPSIDPERVGILGGSYGGYMTSWAVGHTDRFAAACSERAVNDLLGLEHASDIAGSFRQHLGVTHLDDPELYESMSPIRFVREITTPLLIVHSEDDLRCPIEQADQLFVALRMLGRDVELVRFPAEGHELSRSGSPAHRIQRAEIILEFFARHLRPSPSP